MIRHHMWLCLLLAGLFQIAGLCNAAGADLSYEGSSSIGDALLPELAQAFTAETGIPFGDIRASSSNQGFAAVKEGKAAIGGLSRLLTQAELESGLANRVIGYDALVVAVHPDNPVTSLTMGQLADIFAGKITNWQQVGGPDRPIITLYRAGEEGGVVGQFREVVMGGQPLASPSFAFPTHQENLEYVAANPAAITFAAMIGDKGLTRYLAIDGVLPTQDTLSLGQYPLGRPFVLVYRDEQPVPAVTKFIEFVLSKNGQAIVRKYVQPVMVFE
ncbi:MAG: Phosphate ABC transporter, periplasmic phosphate-binding protein PstS [Candidatus Ozemobacter sibiricus]|jgi:phosphate transport system substrate-binding protein|uniref:Phosphate ABC transporter, periplasmic phosphate-binding protein PstS n=1 Tax=Candidatus Ozemobacter sibiricus TaxID=2268124 RepID=A0A367ZM97_9BACT|nr:MAG: Phosphate ABC transporter, periplasmic phosphate-binding protein PstS [Candidatus Ozemobacter sibiricus]